MSTSFFNDRNRNIARELTELIVETNQDLPEWLDRIANEVRSGARGGARRGQSGGSRFGGRDHRLQQNGGGGAPNGLAGANRGFGNTGGSSYYNPPSNNFQRPAAQQQSSGGSGRAVSLTLFFFFLKICQFLCFRSERVILVWVRRDLRSTGFSYHKKKRRLLYGADRYLSLLSALQYLHFLFSELVGLMD